MWQEKKKVRLILDLTKRCNMRCTGCIYLLYDKNYFTNDDMSIDDAKVIVKSFVDKGISEIYLTAEGEISLVRYLPSLIRYISDLGVKVLLNTNGLVMTDELETVLLEEVKTIYISLDGYDGNTYERHRGVDGYDKVVANINRLISRREQLTTKPYIAIAYVAYEERIQDVATMISLAEELEVDRIEFYNFHQPLESVPGFTPLTLASKQVIDVYSSILGDTSHTVEIALPCPLGIENNTFYCENLFKTATVGTKGYLAPCCRIPPDQKYGTPTEPTGEIASFQKSMQEAKSINDLPQPCHKCQGLNSKTFVFSPSEHKWKERILRDGVETMQDYQSISNTTTHWASVVVHNIATSNILKSLEEKEEVIQRQKAMNDRSHARKHK